MTPLLFKQWIYPPNKKSTEKVMPAMINYIATRPGVLCSEYSHGLFGKLSEMKTSGDIKSMSEAIEKSRAMAKIKSTMYNSVISFKNSDAEEIGLNDRADWKNLAERQMPLIARKMNIPLSRLEWVASVHLEEGHPHMHIIYWDCAPPFTVMKINPQKSNEIRKEIIRDVYSEDLKELYADKDKTKKELTNDEATKILTAALNKIGKRNVTDLLGEKSKLPKTNAKINYRKNLKAIKNVAKSIPELSRLLKEKQPKGRLSYQFLSEEMKAEIDKISENIIKQSADVLNAYEKLLDLTRKHAELYGGENNILHEENKIKQEIRKAIGNKILSAVKDYRQYVKIDNREEYYAHQAAVYIANGTLFAIGQLRNNIKDQHRTSSVNLQGHDLTDEEITEFIKKMRNQKEIEWR